MSCELRVASFELRASSFEFREARNRSKATCRLFEHIIIN
jgi:hypothetical protein